MVVTDTILNKDKAGDTQSSEESLRVAVIEVVRMAIESILYTVFCYISTKWLLDRYQLRQTRADLPITQQSNQANMKESLEHMGFEMFARFLIQQHNIQHLLFVIEMSKFKAELSKHGLVEKDALGKYLEVEDILKRIDSAVVDAESFYRNCKHIMDNYIDKEGEYTVNISASMRTKVLEAFEELCKRRRGNIKDDAFNDKEMVILKMDTSHTIADGATQTRQERIRDEKTEADKESGRRLDRDNVSINLFFSVIELGFQDVWALLEHDSFGRFRCTKEFHDYKNNRLDNHAMKVSIPV